ncbi:MAG: HU family DNA-binding protein [Bacteroidales bacterium]|nr:HU family DNA-binding protein [Bacteroidales bacterium]
MKYIAHYNGKVQKWFPRSISSGKTITTARLMDEVAGASTVAPADVAAVLRALSDAMRGHLSDGDKVKLDNIGTFYLMADASGNGVATEAEVSAQQINRVNVRFTAQKKRVGGGGKALQVPVLVSDDIRWERADAPESDGGDTPTPTPTPDGGGDEG